MPLFLLPCEYFQGSSKICLSIPINFYLDFDNFERNPRPQTVEEWFTLYNKQMEFLNARNARIHQSINNVLKYL